MKLVTYQPLGSEPRIGVMKLYRNVEFIVDAARAYGHALQMDEGDSAAVQIAAARIPPDMKSFLAGNEAALQAARRGLALVGALLSDSEAVAELIGQGILYERKSVRLLAPVPRPGKVVAVGANYRDHIKEGRDAGAITDLPSYPPAFLKMSTAVIGTDEPVVFPSFGGELDYEVEFSMVVGKPCKDIRKEDWLDYVVGFTIVNDLSMRDTILEEKESGIVFAGKNFATSCPMGPYLVTKDEIEDVTNLSISLSVNGQVRQNARTSSMIHSCGEILAYWSKLGLECGDIVTTGTPGGGAGFGRRYPERLLKSGDIVEAQIEGLGVLRNLVTGSPAKPPID